MSIKNVDEMLDELYQTVPDVYTRCSVLVPNNKGDLRSKKCILNLTTGDIFNSRKLDANEKYNCDLVRRYGAYYSDGRRVEPIFHYAYQKAQVINDKIVLSLWVFGDYMNYPETSRLEPYSCYGDVLIDYTIEGEKFDESALSNIVLSEPQIASVIVIDQDKEIYHWNDLDRYERIDADKDDHYGKIRHLSGRLVNALFNSNDAANVVGLAECFKEVFKIGYAGANKFLSFDSHKDVPAFMKSEPMQMRSGKKQNRVNELVSVKLPDHTKALMTDKTVCFADRVNDEWVCLRWWLHCDSVGYIETSRMYVSKTESIHCRSNLNGEWVYAAAKIKAKTFNADKVVLQSPEVFDGTKLEYFKSISTEMANQSAALYMLTTFPEFEKMYKVGLGWLCDIYLANDTYQMSWKTFLNDYVGYVDWSSKNIFKMLGINKHQLESFNKFRERMEEPMREYCDYWTARRADTIIEKMKYAFCENSISHIDDATFDYILNSITPKRIAYGYTYALSSTYRLYGNDAIYFIKDLNAISNDTMLEVTSQYGYTCLMDADRIYSDTMSMINSGGYAGRIRPRFSSIEELFNHHNIMIDLINADAEQRNTQMNAQYSEGFKKNSERWKKWEWDEDEVFCVIAPVEPLDVAVEGITLRHCVRSYIPSVSLGQTNIMFIRRKGQETEPFFTVEVDTHNNIRQVHGMCNCNANTVEGLLDFIKKWTKAKKLKYSAQYANGIRAVGR